MGLILDCARGALGLQDAASSARGKEENEVESALEAEFESDKHVVRGEP